MVTRSAACLALLLWLSGCRSITIDPSREAIASNDITLINAIINRQGAGCSTAPGQGADICRFVHGSRIVSEWALVLPSIDGNVVKSGEIRLRYKDRTYVHQVLDPITYIPLRSLVNHDHWELEDDGVIQALGQIKYINNEGHESFIDVLGFALIVVLQENYNPMPIDSGNHAVTEECDMFKFQYSTSGRSAITCSRL